MAAVWKKRKRGRERGWSRNGREAKGSSMWKSATHISSFPTSVCNVRV
jgi:hypothetical protein